MAKDYAKRGSKKPSKKGKKGAKSKAKKGQASRKSSNKKESLNQGVSRVRAFLLLVSVLVLIALVVLALKFIFVGRPPSPLKTPGPAVVQATPVKALSYTKQVLHPVSFDFEANANQAEPSQAYALQLGTYQTGDALFLLQDKLKKNGVHYKKIKLLRLGLTYYRIQMGPYSSQALALAKQKKLESKQVYSVLIGPKSAPQSVSEQNTDAGQSS